MRECVRRRIIARGRELVNRTTFQSSDRWNEAKRSSQGGKKTADTKGNTALELSGWLVGLEGMLMAFAFAQGIT